LPSPSVGVSFVNFNHKHNAPITRFKLVYDHSALYDQIILLSSSFAITLAAHDDDNKIIILGDD